MFRVTRDNCKRKNQDFTYILATELIADPTAIVVFVFVSLSTVMVVCRKHTYDIDKFAMAIGRFRRRPDYNFGFSEPTK